MKKFLSFALLASSILHAQSAQELFESKCATCHITSHPKHVDKSTLIAPPAMGVIRHVKEAFDGDRKKTIAFIEDYAFNPSRKKAKCRDHAIERFGIMPSQKGIVTEEELSKIAVYMHDTFSNAKACKNRD